MVFSSIISVQHAVARCGTNNYSFDNTVLELTIHQFCLTKGAGAAGR
jgi:hypothetical protein